MARARNRKGQFTKRRRTTTTRRRRPAARRRTYRRNPGVAEMMLMNPNPPRKRRRKAAPRQRTSSYRRTMRRTSKALIPSIRGIMGTVQEGAFLAAGSVVVSQVMARFVPETLKAGPMKHAVRLGVSVVGGNLIGKYVNAKFGRAFTLGGVMTTIIIAANEYLGGAIVPLGGMEEMALGAYYAAPAMGAYYSPGMVSAQPDFLGWETDVPDRLSPGNRF